MGPERYFETSWKELFTFSKDVQQQFQETRLELYEKIMRIIRELNLDSVLDVGCAFGLLVESCNREGIDAWGFDLPIDNFKSYHLNLPHSQGKFHYGSVSDEKFEKISNSKEFGAVVISDTLRHLVNPYNLIKLNFKYIIIRELSKNLYMRRGRKKQKLNLDVKLYSPRECLRLFKGYHPFRIYFYRYSKKLNLPNKFSLFLINAIFPSYTLVLKRNEI